jgi:hypothetical protein
MKSTFLLFIICIGFSFSNQAQDLAPGFKLWGSVGLDWEITNKFSLKYAQLLGYNANPAKLQFVQPELEVFYKTGKLLTIGLGYKANFLKNGGTFNLNSRVYNELVFRHKFLKLPIKHTITSEFFFPRLPKHRYRFIYSLNYYFKNNFLPFKMTPYLKGEIYYYLGGKNISYYDQNSNLIVRQAPNDFHRYRLGGGITSKPLPFMRATLYYLYQQEFNTTLTENRGLNVLSKDQTYHKQPFNNYHVIGLELEFDIDTKKASGTSKIK